MKLNKLPLLFVVFLITVSCKKEIEELPLESSIEISTPPPAPIFVVDNFKNVRQLGAKGDGQTDDSDILQSIINQNDTVVFDGGVYIINNSLKLKNGSRIIGKNGATIKSGQNMKGTLMAFARYFTISDVKGASVFGLTFQPSNQNFNISKWLDACILVSNSVDVAITDNTFDFKLPYDIFGYEAIWVTGPKTNNTLIKGNKLYTVGIKYAENGANGTIVESNMIKDAHSNALTANGNSSTSKACKLLNNTIENSGRMAIEDWGAVDGTLMQGNVIIGCGKGSSQAADGMGISAVGTNSFVINNKISDAKTYYLEVGGNHNILAQDNIIIDTEKKGTGIILNYTGELPPNVTNSNSQLINNSISGCEKSIHIFGSAYAKCIVKGNKIIDPKDRGISIENFSVTNDIMISGNYFTINNPTSIPRILLNSNNNLAFGVSRQNVTIDDNHITYNRSASGGSGFDIGFLISSDRVNITNNEIIGNNNKSGGYDILGLTCNGGTATNLKIMKNKVSGTVVDLKGFLNSTISDNIFP